MTDAFAYDVLPYPSQVHAQMHPSRLAAIARLHGIPAASPKDCRLLELGCGDGLQLVALAMAYPQSRFIGVDLSASAIARGEALRRKLGLDNLELVVADLLEWNVGDLRFDYVVAHGFWSWVPPQVRERLLAICAANLATAGIAYISYNALPGCHLRQMMRQMLEFHVDHEAPPQRQIEQGAHFLAWLEHALPASGEGYVAAVRHELDNHLKRITPALLIHDDLSPWNTPYLFTEFMALARAHGLDYLAEADYFESTNLFVAEEPRARLDEFAGGDRIVREQYMDFLKGRRFRQSLLRRAGPERELDCDALFGLEANTRLQAGQPDAGGMRFSTPDGAAMVLSHPLSQAVFLGLAESIGPTRLSGLRERAAAALGMAPTAEDDAALAEALVFAFRIGLLTLSCDAPTWAVEPGDTPRASALARAQLDGGGTILASLRPAIVHIDDPLGHQLMHLLDGTRDRAALLRELRIWAAANPGRAADHALDAEALDAALQGLAGMALLEA